MSGYENIKKAIEHSGRGHIFFPDDFSANESSDTIRSSLVRLCSDNFIIRLAQGIYFYPEIEIKWGIGTITPSLEKIASAIARKERCRIAPTGSTALNALGLSSQMPVNTVYYTDGSPRNIKIGKGRGILFKRSTNMKRFAYHNKKMQLIVAALREIGNGKVQDKDIAIIAKNLKGVKDRDFIHDSVLAPVWVQKILHELK